MILRHTFFSSPGRTLLSSILITIAMGTLLLSLPFAQKVPLALSDIVFTATSATCVTGLLTVPLDSFTLFGQLVILALIQIGGLGIITLTVFLMSLFLEIGLGIQLMTEQILEIESWRRSKRIIGFIVAVTLFMELLGSLAVYSTIRHLYPLKQGIYYAIFHTISAFCSSGFTIFGHDLQPFQHNLPFLIITSILLLVGSIGFITLYEILTYIKKLRHKRHYNFSLHSRLVLIITAALIVVTAITIWFLERHHAFATLSWPAALVNTIFSAISFRSAGFTTMDMATMHLATYFLIMIIAFIGSSPGSTGSGIKTTTFALFLGAIRAVVTGRMVVEVKGRRIPNDQIFKAMAVLSLSLTWVALTMFCLLISEEGWRFVDIMFEAFSAFANLGLSSGITPHLSFFGKLVIMLSMIIGRIGSLTLILALKRRQERVEFNYPEERVIIG